MYSDAHLGSKVWSFTQCPKGALGPYQAEGRWEKKRKGVMDETLFQIQAQLLCHSNSCCSIPIRKQQSLLKKGFKKRGKERAGMEGTCMEESLAFFVTFS